MAKNQTDSNDRLEINGFDYIVRQDSSYETVDGAALDFIGDVRVNGSPMSPATAAGYVHTQGSPSVTWTINHNLGYRPVVDLYNTGNQKFMAQVDHPTVNQTIITVLPATAGFARLI